jgi:DNA adenine methylase
MVSNTASLFPGFEQKKSLNPPLKWAGGKRWLVPKLRDLYEPHTHRRLVEPFTGGMAVALGLLPERALLADISPHLINFYRRLQSGLTTIGETANDETHFYAARERFNKLLEAGQSETQEAAELFYYLNRTCFNGLCRFNSKGSFNVPFGRYKNINYRADFEEYAAILSGWELCRGDFETLEIESEDFIYADPPYDTPFTRYAKEDFNWDDQKRLALWLGKHPGPVVASNQATDRILELYKELGFTIETMEAPRRISCNGDRTPALEMLATKGI